ncbi:MAG: YtxH domain-containing protein [Cyclobacteriaceae bacterium]|jgi:gas vesicle protein|nr:YtxH domain-containing protein [Cyclobacteriaceae bacterium]MDH4296042.1 YtxH domain-containing protein [Cyclobacteriaceae bacterium]MDH5249810.1 YtxH domain-containing protein [Cyclobacteriaceae bacterium]
MKNAVQITTGFITGALLGKSLAFLFTSKSGSKMRLQVSDWVRTIADTVTDMYLKTKLDLLQKKRENEKLTV